MTDAGVRGIIVSVLIAGATPLLANAHIPMSSDSLLFQASFLPSSASRRQLYLCRRNYPLGTLSATLDSDIHIFFGTQNLFVLLSFFLGFQRVFPATQKSRLSLRHCSQHNVGSRIRNSTDHFDSFHFLPFPSKHITS